MPIQYRIDPDQELVWVRMEGIVAGDDFEEYRRRLEGDPLYSPGLRRLFDLRGVPAPSTAQIRGLVEIIAKCALPTPARRAILVDSDVSFGMYRMMEMLLEGRALERFRVFRARDEALAWLLAPPGERPISCTHAPH